MTVGSEQQSSQPQNSDSICNTILSQYSKTEDEQATKAVCVDVADLPMPVDLTASEGCSPPKKKQKCFDICTVYLVGRCELSDIKVNYAQHLIKLQFIHLNGLQSTLLQEKLFTGTSEIKNKLQIIFCKQ